MTSILEKGGETFEGIKLLLCENPLPSIVEAIAAAQADAPRSNYYTTPFLEPLRRFIADFTPHNAADQADRLRERGVFIKPLNDDAILGPGFMRVTTALQENNARVVQDLRELL